MIGHLLAVGQLVNLTDWLKGNVLDVVLIGIGILILVKARSQEHKGAMSMVGIVLIGLFVVGLAVGGGALNFGQWITSLITG